MSLNVWHSKKRINIGECPVWTVWKIPHYLFDLIRQRRTNVDWTSFYIGRGLQALALWAGFASCAGCSILFCR